MERGFINIIIKFRNSLNEFHSNKSIRITALRSEYESRKC